ncbi:MAG: alanine racemase [Gammaproteobacteria bacterium]|nr:alanine racemase [Gammaproteobacteria bacterium]
MTRATRAVVSLSALQHNLDVARRAAPHSRHMAIIKANAYGHGLLPIARALHNADAFGVATVDEAISLREGGIPQPIVLLEGFSSAEELHLLRAYNLQSVIHEPNQIKLLERHTGKAVTVWLKLDTGMHRLGFVPGQCSGIMHRLVACENVEQPIKVMTHLSCADDRKSDVTTRQIAAFKVATSICPELHHSVANSAGILGWPETHYDWVRPGIMLYGVSPFTDSQGKDHDLQPVMSLHSHLISVKSLRAGDKVGYGGSWSAPKDMSMGVVAIGYGDGYPRHAKPGTPVLVNQQRASLIGRVSMDMITVDLSQCPDAKIGDPVLLWGKDLPVETIATHADTIAYALLCGVTQRVKYEYQG